MTEYNIELLFSEDTPKDLQEAIHSSIHGISLFYTDLRIHEEKLHYIPVIEFSAIYGVPARKKKREVYDYLSSRVEVKRGRSRFEILGWPRPHRSRRVHY